MAGIGPQDQPDWVRFSQQASSPIVSSQAINLPTAVAVDLGTFYVGNLPALYVFAGVTAGASLCRVTLTFYNDLAATQPVGFSTIYVAGNAQTVDYVPVKGGWVNVQMGGVGPGHVATTGQLTIVGIASGFNHQNLLSHLDPAVGTAAAVASGAFLTITCPFNAAGTWYAAGGSFGVGLRILIDQMFSNGIWSRVGAYSGLAVQDLTGPVGLFPAPTRLLVLNTNAAAQDLTGALMPAA